MKISEKRKRLVFAKYDGRCAYCGCNIHYDTFQPDHIIARSTLKKRDSAYFVRPPGMAYDALENLNPSCAQCNRQKWDRSVADFKKFIELSASEFIDKNPKAALL